MLKRTIALLAAALTLSNHPPAFAQGAQKPQPPKRQISLEQRAEIRALSMLVDRVATGGTVGSMAPMTWQGHFFKGLNGQVYIPYTLTLQGNPDQFQSIALYVRVVRRLPDGSSPTPVSASSGGSTLSNVPVLPGEMPVGGPSIQNPRLQASAENSARLALVQREIDRTREAARVAEFFLFEDFDFVAVEAPAGGQPYRLRRAVAVPPGEYDVYVAIKEVGDRLNIRSSVLKQPLTVPDLARPELGVSSVILAERVQPLSAPIPPERQSERPYALGSAEVTPASSSQFSTAQEMSVVFQILNPTPDEAKKPNITVDYSFHHGPGDTETLLTASRQTFDAKVLPAGFDLSAGHQLFASQFVPLATFEPGPYRLEIKVTDNNAAKAVTEEVEFTVLGSPASSAPWRPAAKLKAASFRGNDVLRPDVVGYFLDKAATLQPQMTPGVRSALERARAGQYASLLTDLAIEGGEQAATSFLRGLALLALTDNLESAAAQFRAALRDSSDFLPAAFYLGAVYAAYGRDRQAVGAWQLVLAETELPIVHTILADTFMRLGETPQALRVLQEAAAKWPAHAEIERRRAAAYSMADRPQEALGVLGPYLEDHLDDTDSLFLAVRLMYETKHGSRLSTDERDRLLKYARAYADRNGAEKVLVERWVSALEKP